jgi:tripartite motif-containing protein 71
MKTRSFLPEKMSWALAAEIILLAYVALVVVLELRIIMPLVTAPPLQHPKVSETWTVGKVGSGPGEIDAPLGLALDSAGNVYLADRGNHRLQKFGPDGKFLTEWKGDSAGSYPFVEPSGVAVNNADNGVWILDSGNGWVYRLDSTGKMETVVDGQKLGLYSPRGLAVSSSGDIFIADTGMARVLHLDPKGQQVAQWGSSGEGPDQFRDPTGITVQGNSLYVSDLGNKRVVIYSLDGKRVNAWNVEKESAWIAADGLGRVYASNSQTNKIFVYDESGNPISILSPEKEIKAMDHLTGIAAARDGSVVVVSSNQLVRYQIDWK